MTKDQIDFIRSFAAVGESMRLYILLRDVYINIERGIELMNDETQREDCRKLYEKLERGSAMMGNALSMLDDRFDVALCDMEKINEESY